MSLNTKPLSNQDRDYLLSKLECVKDFPKEGVLFSDIAPLLADGRAFNLAITHLYERYKDANIDYIAGIDSRGFLFGSALAYKLNIGFVCIRKQGKLPKECFSESYELEYGTNTLQIQQDAFCKDGKDISNTNTPNVVLIDDIIATGGSANAAKNLINKCNVNLVEICFLISLNIFDGAKVLKPYNVYSILQID